MRNSTKFGNKIVTAVVVLICAALLCGFSVEGRTPDRDARGVDYTATDVYVDGILSDGVGYAVGTSTYMDPVDFFRVLGVECSVSEPEDGELLRMAFGGTVAAVDALAQYMIVGDRVLPVSGTVTVGERLCLRVSDLARLVGAEVSWDTATESVDINATCIAPLESAESFYNADDLYWLSHIIQAEAGSEELRGMIAVGNVVLNRVSVEAFPNSVYEVVFDSRYGIQFSPVESGSIYCDPCDSAVIAAKLCLEGCKTAGESLYFVNPMTGITSWFEETREFVTSIGGHDFYA